VTRNWIRADEPSALRCAGEQLYLLPHASTNSDRTLALLTSDTCSSTVATFVNIVEVQKGGPRAIARPALPGSIRESRLVGESGSVGHRPRLVRWELERDAKFPRRAEVPLNQPATQLYRFNDLLAIFTVGHPELRDATDLMKFRLLNRYIPGCSWWLNLESADGSQAAGLWMPQLDQGLRHLDSVKAERDFSLRP